jgi:hypothetical protein
VWNLIRNREWSLGISPLTQGDVSGECVVYSALNAARFLWPKTLRKLETCEALYGELIGLMREEAVDMLIEGTESDVGLRVGQHMERLLARRGLTLVVEPLFTGSPPTDIPAVFEAIRHSLDDGKMADERRVVVIGLDEPWNHWTVATKATRHTLKIFDSYNRRRLKRLDDEELSLVETEDKIVFDAPAAVVYRRLPAPLS